MEREGNRDVRPLDQALSVSQKAIDRPVEARGGGVEGRVDGIGGHLLQLTGDDGGEHGAAGRLEELVFMVWKLALTGLWLGQAGIETTAFSRHGTTPRSPKPPLQGNSSVMYLHEIPGSVLRPLSGAA